ARGQPPGRGPGDGLAAPLRVLFGRAAPDVGITAGTEAAGGRLADPELHPGDRATQCLSVGIEADEADAADAGTDHPIDCVVAASPDPDDPNRAALRPPDPTDPAGDDHQDAKG